MPRRAKTTPPVDTTTEGASAEAKPARGTKTAAVRAALESNPRMPPREIAELLKAEGWQVKPQQISVIKSNMSRRPKPKTASRVKASEAAPAPAASAAPAQDGISLKSLQQAKQLATQLGGIKQARAAIEALSQLIG